MNLEFPGNGTPGRAWLRRLYYELCKLEVRGDGVTTSVEQTPGGTVVHARTRGVGEAQNRRAETPSRLQVWGWYDTTQTSGGMTIPAGDPVFLALTELPGAAAICEPHETDEPYTVGVADANFVYGDMALTDGLVTVSGAALATVYPGNAGDSQAVIDYRCDVDLDPESETYRKFVVSRNGPFLMLSKATAPEKSLILLSGADSGSAAYRGAGCCRIVNGDLRIFDPTADFYESFLVPGVGGTGFALPDTTLAASGVTFGANTAEATVFARRRNYNGVSSVDIVTAPTAGTGVAPYPGVTGCESWVELARVKGTASGFTGVVQRYPYGRSASATATGHARLNLWVESDTPAVLHISGGAVRIGASCLTLDAATMAAPAGSGTKDINAVLYYTPPYLSLSSYTLGIGVEPPAGTVSATVKIGTANYSGGVWTSVTREAYADVLGLDGSYVI